MTRMGTVIEWAATGPAPAAQAVLIVPLVMKPTPPMETVAHADALCGDSVSQLLEVHGLGDEVGQLGHTTASRGYRRVLAVSLGDGDKIEARHVRQAAAAALHWVVAEKIEQAALWTAGLESTGVENAVGEWVLGMSVAGYRFEEFRKLDKTTPAKLRIGPAGGRGASVGTHGAAGRFDDAARTALRLAEAINYTRRLAQQPGNVIHPASLAAEAQKLARQHKLRCTVLNEAKLRQMSMGGLLAVGQGALHPSCLIRIEYRGAPRVRRNTVLVGKALTFDTGGYSIKPSAGLGGLKFDKTGGCTVLGVLKAAALLKLKCNVTGLVAAAENMVSERAYRPGDVLHMANGKTVEVTNTDAEGRLVLADALWYGQKYCDPTAVIDIATLTGGVFIALGRVAAGLMATDDSLAAALEECGRRVHERLWRLPLWDDYKELMKGTDADLINSSDKREATAIQGGIFLKEFIEDGLPWAHLDIAAVAADDGGPNKGATGYGVRLLVEYLGRSAE